MGCERGEREGRLLWRKVKVKSEFCLMDRETEVIFVFTLEI